MKRDDAAVNNYRNPTFIALLLLVLLVSGTAFSATISVTKSDKCPVCGMFVSHYPEWLARIEFNDRSSVTFDGPKDMFKYYLNPQRYKAKNAAADITAILVTDYYSVEAIDAQKAWYVIGSDVYGPMGKELIPFASESAAAAFVKDHAGKAVVPFGEVDSALIDSID